MTTVSPEENLMPSRISRLSSVLPIAILALGACTTRRVAPMDYDHTESSVAQSAVSPANIPAGSGSVRDRLDRSPRHGEWAMIRTGPTDSVRAWVVYPERATKAPVVVIVHEIFGLSTWVRGVADQLAADGYIAVAPDLLTGKAPLQGDTLTQDVAVAAIRTLDPKDVQRQLEAVGRYGMSLPAALPRYGIVGFCWGGGVSFEHAVRSPAGLGAAVVYYGVSPKTTDLASIRSPVLGLYGGRDMRVDATIPPADSAMRSMGKVFEPHVFEGAGHGFLRAQDDSTGANLAASKSAWPLTVAFFRKYLGA